MYKSGNRPVRVRGMRRIFVSRALRHVTRDTDCDNMRGTSRLRPLSHSRKRGRKKLYSKSPIWDTFVHAAGPLAPAAGPDEDALEMHFRHRSRPRKKMAVTQITDVFRRAFYFMAASTRLIYTSKKRIFRNKSKNNPLNLKKREIELRTFAADSKISIMRAAVIVKRAVSARWDEPRAT